MTHLAFPLLLLLLPACILNGQEVGDANDIACQRFKSFSGTDFENVQRGRTFFWKFIDDTPTYDVK
jgi:hypothetical protein